MDLRDYLHVNRLTLREFADKLGITPNYLGAIKRGEEIPSKQLAKLINLITEGEVCFDIHAPVKKKKRPRSSSSRSKPK